MAEVGNIKPPGPIWPQPVVEKIKQQEDQSEQRRRQEKNTPPSTDEDNSDDDSGIDEYA